MTDRGCRLHHDRRRAPPARLRQALRVGRVRRFPVDVGIRSCLWDTRLGAGASPESYSDESPHVPGPWGFQLSIETCDNTNLSFGCRGGLAMTSAKAFSAHDGSKVDSRPGGRLRGLADRFRPHGTPAGRFVPRTGLIDEDDDRWDYAG